MRSETDVIIIGAGAAGLCAAKELTRLGVSHVVVEGTHRIGGRAYSEEIAPGVWFDLGCSYLHDGEMNPFGPIADKLGVALARDQADLFNPERMVVTRNGARLTGTARAAYWEYVSACHDAIVAASQDDDTAIVDVDDAVCRHVEDSL